MNVSNGSTAGKAVVLLKDNQAYKKYSPKNCIFFCIIFNSLTCDTHTHKKSKRRGKIGAKECLFKKKKE